MAIPPCGCFDYVVAIPDRPLPWPAEQHARDKHALTGDPIGDDRLVGPAPMLSISQGWLTFTASSTQRAQMKAVSLQLAPAFASLFRAHDLVEVVRTRSGAVALSVVRSNSLLVAIGAVSALSLEPLSVSKGSALSPEFLDIDGRVVPAEGGRTEQKRVHLPWLRRSRWPSGQVLGLSRIRETDPALYVRFPEGWEQAETWVDVQLGDETRRLGAAQAAEIGPYGIAVERSFRPGVPGDEESVAVFLLNADVRELAIESAHLLRASTGLRMAPW
jgi:hypothetical protein